MIHEATIEVLEKLTYVDKVEKLKGFYISIFYNNEKSSRKISRRVGPKKLLELLDKIKQEINYENEKTDKTMPFYVA